MSGQRLGAPGRPTESAVKSLGDLSGKIVSRPKKRVAMSLVAKLGFEPVDAGPLRIARLLEPYGMLWIDQALNRGRGRSFAFAITNRPGAD